MPNKKNSGEQSCCMRFGYVSDYDSTKHAARIKFPDMGDMISGWLPVGVRNTKENKDTAPLDINEHVCCLLSGTGIEEGVILCAIYDDQNPPVKLDENTRSIKFNDETEIYYDRAEHELRIENKAGSYIIMRDERISIHGASRVEITAPRIDLN